ncbi:MAG TPA: ComEC/Rec2 family competence protein, partial [Methylococcales bacterium]
KILNGKILAYAGAYEDHSYGDTVNFAGTLKRPESFEGFDYPKYLRGKNIYLVSYYPTLKKIDSGGGFYGAIFAFRKKADENINKILPSPAGNIVSAMTLGMTSPEIKEVMAKFNQTGTSHVIVVSGSHLVIIVAILMFFLLRLGVNRGKAFYLTNFGIFTFVILSGSSASAIRSGIMAFVFLLAVKVGRGGDAMRALIFSAAAMIFFNPYILAGDVGFQLSFLATFGLIVILPLLQNKFRAYPQWGGVKDIFLTTLAAQIAVFPVLITNFGQFSLLSFVANILILPTVPVLMVGGFLLIGVSFVNIFLAKVIAFPVYFLVSYEIAVVDFLSRTDWGMIKF